MASAHHRPPGLRGLLGFRRAWSIPAWLWLSVGCRKINPRLNQRDRNLRLTLSPTLSSTLTGYVHEETELMSAFPAGKPGLVVSESRCLFG